MLSTLIKLGAQLSEHRGEWDDIIDQPNVEKELKKGIPLYIGELIFDLDQQDIYFGTLKEYEGVQSCFEYKYIKIQGGNNKAIYTCVEAGKLEQIRKTFFGTIDSKGKSPVSGQFQEVLQKDFPAFSNTLLARLLPLIFILKEKFEDKACTLKEVKGQMTKVIDEKKLISDIKALGPNDRMILYYTSVVSAKDGLISRTPICEIEGFEKFMRAKFLDKEKTTGQKISYATGGQKENVTGIDFPNRYSLNYMFVETTLNYATGFNKNLFHKNYQLNGEEQLFLERGSKYVLDHLKIRIAGVEHCIIPQFLSYTYVDIPYITDRILRENELLFTSSSISRLASGIEKETDQPYWLTYLAFESDGNFFKTIHQIKDVSKLHFYQVMEAFQSTYTFFKEEISFAVDWLSVLREYGKAPPFNLSTIYSIIPVRKEKEAKNEALNVFKSIFENRRIEKSRLFKFFGELVLCHRFQRYRSYTNIRTYEDGAFDFAIRDAVFKYLAFIQVLQKLKLITIMEENKTAPLPSEGAGDEYSRKIYNFFDRFGYNEGQRAMFFLGRMLNKVAFQQEGKRKTVLDKVNFNGMKPAAIQRLRISLIEKAVQYNAVKKVVFDDAEFSRHFNYNNWNMNAEEAVFFLLSGYSFGITLSKDNKKQTTDNS